MNSLLILLLLIFGGVALMVVLGEKFAEPAAPERLAKLQRWLIPLLCVAAAASFVDYYFL
ncbi:MAG: hypothetical protein ACI9JM_001082 [Halioglobus sp.]|jgi:hypothetical protein